MAKEKEKDNSNLFDYNEESIKSLDWKEHIRLRPGMYIGKLGDGSSPDDGIYVLSNRGILYSLRCNRKDWSCLFLSLLPYGLVRLT